LVIFFISNVVAVDLPVEAFSRLPSIKSPALSPDGSKIAYLKNVENPDLTLLIYIDLKSGEFKTLLQTDNLTNQIRWFKWANNETVLLAAKFSRHMNTEKVDHTQLLAIDVGAEQTKQRRLINASTIYSRRHYSQHEDKVIDLLRDDPTHILIALDAENANLPSVFKLNINTAKANKVENHKLKIRQWMTDQQGFVRLGSALNYKTGAAKIFVRKGDNQNWQILFQYNSLEDAPVTALGFDKNPNILYYTQYNNDKKALYKVDLSTDIHQLVFADKDYDVDGALIYSKKTRSVIGIHHISGNIYWDESRKSLQQRLDKARPKTTNYLVDFSEDEYVYIF
jgi:hypothetical protein